MRKSLVGNWQPAHVFVLEQSRLLYQSYQQQIARCDREIEKRLSGFEPRVDPAQQPLPPDRKRNRNAARKRRKQGLPETGFDLRTEAFKLFGVDVTQIPGLELSVLPLFSEVGRDLSSRWRTAPHFVSWLNLCPDNDISGGRVLWKGTRKIHSRAGQIFRMAAYSLHRSPTPLGNYLRRMKAKLGPQAATTATAHKIAIIFYSMITKQVEYDESIWAARDAQREKRLQGKIERQAKQLGYKLVPMEEKPAA
jgi:transposase